MKYLLKKIWPLVILLIASYVIVFTKCCRGRLYAFAEAYAVFASYVIASGLLCQPLAKLIHPHYTDEGWFSCHEWEDGGKIYDRLFKVSRYKDRAVNAARIFGREEERASRSLRNPETIMAAIEETCRSEIVHWILIILSPMLLVLIHSGLAYILWGAYLISNFKDIIIQRYNRPRFVRLHKSLREKESK